MISCKECHDKGVYTSLVQSKDAEGRDTITPRMVGRKACEERKNDRSE